MTLEFSRQIFEKSSNIRFLWKSVQWEPSCSMRTDRRTDRRTERRTDMTELIVSFRNFATAPKSPSFHKHTNISLRQSKTTWYELRCKVKATRFFSYVRQGGRCVSLVQFIFPVVSSPIVSNARSPEGVWFVNQNVFNVREHSKADKEQS
jgi:hypothetical protein